MAQVPGRRIGNRHLPRLVRQARLVYPTSLPQAVIHPDPGSDVRDHLLYGAYVTELSIATVDFQKVSALAASQRHPSAAVPPSSNIEICIDPFNLDPSYRSDIYEAFGHIETEGHYIQPHQALAIGAAVIALYYILHPQPPAAQP